MKIAIDLTSLYGRKRTGVEVYAIDLYHALMTTGHTIIPICHVKNELDSNPNSYIIRKCNRLWLENIALCKAIRKIDADIAFFPVFPPPIGLYGRCRSKIYPTIHDTAFIKFRETLNFAAKYYFTPKAKKALRKADGIITVSDTVRKQLAQYTKLSIFNLENIIAAEYRNATQKVHQSFLQKWNLSEGEYYVSVSTIEPRKNMSYLLEVIVPLLKIQNRKLVLVGRRGWENGSELDQWAAKAGNILVFTDYVSMDELFSLYHFSYAFVLLSKDEGFGRTPFEAVACGCKRIILSDIPIFHETFDGNALFVPLDNVEKARMLIENNETLVSDLDVPFDNLEKNVIVFLQHLCVQDVARLRAGESKRQRSKSKGWLLAQILLLCVV